MSYFFLQTRPGALVVLVWTGKLNDLRGRYSQLKQRFGDELARNASTLAESLSEDR